MATLVVNTAILTTIGVASGTAAGLVIAPRLINMQGQTSGLGAGISDGLPATTIAEILAVALATAGGRGARPGPPYHPDRRLGPPAQPGPSVTIAAAGRTTADPVDVTRRCQAWRFPPSPSGHTSK